MPDVQRLQECSTAALASTAEETGTAGSSRGAVGGPGPLCSTKRSFLLLLLSLCDFPAAGFLNPALNLLPGDESCPQSYSGGVQGREQALGLFWVPSLHCPPGCCSTGLPTAGGSREHLGQSAFPRLPGLCGPQAQSPATHLHEVPMVLRRLQVVCQVSW